MNPMPQPTASLYPNLNTDAPSAFYNSQQVPATAPRRTNFNLAEAGIRRSMEDVTTANERGDERSTAPVTPEIARRAAAAAAVVKGSRV